MKKTLSAALVLALLLLACCAQGPVEPSPTPLAVVAVTPQPTPAPTPAPTPEPTPESSPEPVIQYGSVQAISTATAQLAADIRFPQAGGFADGVIAAWAQEIYDVALALMEEQSMENPLARGGVFTTFDAYLVRERFVGILERGQFSGPAGGKDILQAFNLDLERQVFLENREIIDPAQQESTLFLLRDVILAQYPEAASHLSAMDRSWLESLALGREGVMVLLERGAFLPETFGSLIVTLPYDDLGDALCLGAAPPEPLPPSLVHLTLPQGSYVDPSRPMVALTFDDGPGEHTGALLDILAQYGVRATFCVLGKEVASYADVVERAAGLGCEVIGHSWNHRNLTTLSREEVESQILNTHQAITAVVGSAPLMYRPPYGAEDDAVRGISQDLGFALIMWSVDPQDWLTKDADLVYLAVMENVRDRAIVLTHDVHPTTIEAMARVIPELLAQGYQLVTVSELMYYSDREVMSGGVYRRGR